MIRATRNEVKNKVITEINGLVLFKLHCLYVHVYRGIDRQIFGMKQLHCTNSGLADCV